MLWHTDDMGMTEPQRGGGEQGVRTEGNYTGQPCTVHALVCGKWTLVRTKQALPGGPASRAMLPPPLGFLRKSVYRFRL